MAEPKQSHLPIGYWLKKADEALTARINEAQRANGLSRLEWQVLNVFHEAGSVSFERIAETLRPFADTATLVEVLERLVQSEHIEATRPEAPIYRLTDQGARLHVLALASQKDVRRQAMQGVSDEDYATTVRVLQQLVENVGKGGAS